MADAAAAPPVKKEEAKGDERPSVKRVKVKKWKAVAFWAYGACVRVCVIVVVVWLWIGVLVKG